MRDQGVVVGLGTDGPSSGNTLDLFTQMKLYRSCIKMSSRIGQLFRQIGCAALYQRSGKVLKSYDRIGSLEVGKRADTWFWGGCALYGAGIRSLFVDCL